MYLQQLRHNRLALLLWGQWAFIMTMGGGVRVIGKDEHASTPQMRFPPWPHSQWHPQDPYEGMLLLKWRSSCSPNQTPKEISPSSSSPRGSKHIPPHQRHNLLQIKKLKVNITWDKHIGFYPSKLCISTNVVPNNRSQHESQSIINATLKCIFGEHNIVGINFGYNNNHMEECQVGWCHIQCPNTVMYTEWLHKSTYMLGTRVDFISHKGSMDMASPNPTAILLAQALVWEVIT